MNLNLRRTTKTAEACLGVLEVDGSFECYTLEDPDGAGDRIDAGTYNVITDFSNRFQKIMPLLTGPKVDGRGIRIHCGNTQADTEGCILLGQSEGVNEIEGSRLAFNAFFPKLEAALVRGETVTLAVTDEIQLPTDAQQLNNVPLKVPATPQSNPRPDKPLPLMTSLLGMLMSRMKRS